MQNTDYQIWKLMARTISNEATPAEREQLDELLSNQPEQLEQFELLKKFWQPNKEFTNVQEEQQLENKALSLIAKSSAEKESEEFAETISSGFIKRIFTLKNITAIAASILILIAAIFIFKTNPTKNKTLNEIVANPGSKTRTLLPDGSVVWLNNGSKLAVANNFNEKNREVYLVGEAYFDIKHDASKPFIVKTPAINIKVLGTIFDVKAYPDENKTEASLIKGKIEVSFNTIKHEKIILNPSEKIIVNNTAIIQQTKEEKNPQRLVSIQKAILLDSIQYDERDNVNIETSWKENKLIFRDMNFDDLAKTLSRWYDVKIIVKDSVLINKKMNGTFENETIYQALDALQISFPFNYFKQNQNEIIITK